jgi:hypothetical protein
MRPDLRHGESVGLASSSRSWSRNHTFLENSVRTRDIATRGFKYRVRIATSPDIVMVCENSAGIQTARLGGTTQVPSRVRIVITPRDA